MTVEAPARPDETTRELEALMAEARRRARRRRFGYAAGALAVLLAVGAVLFLDDAGEPGPTRDGANIRSNAAGGEEDVLFARAIVDSREGVFAIEPGGEVKRLRVRMSCGDTPFCLISTAGELVISSVGRTTAYDPAGDGAARFGNGWITIPSARSGHVWLGVLARGKLGGPHRRGLRAVREVDLAGNVVQQMRPPRGQWPVGAVESGLLFEYGRSLRLWSFAERRFTLRLPGAFPAAAAANLVAASRGGDRPELALTDTRNGDVAEVAPPPGYQWTGQQGVFTSDGARLAVPLASGALGVIDAKDLDAQVIPGGIAPDPDYTAMAWSSDGDRLFFVAADGAVVSYDVASDSLTTVAELDPDDVVLQMVSVRPRP